MAPYLDDIREDGRALEISVPLPRDVYTNGFIASRRVIPQLASRMHNPNDHTTNPSLNSAPMIGQPLPTPTSSIPGNPYIDVFHRKAAPKPHGWTDAINNGVWSEEEHARFMEALRMYPGGPWRLVAEHVGTRTVRQVQTHMQKINEKARRHRRGLHKKRKERPRSEPIGSVSAISSSDDDERASDSDQSVIFDPIVLSPSWDAAAASSSTEAFGEDELVFDDSLISELNLDGMEDLFGALFTDLSS